MIIDPVLETTRRDLQQVQDLGVKLLYVLKTHLHADHVTGAAALRAVTGARVAVSRMNGIREADLGLDDGARITLGDSQILYIATPGHTPGCLSYYTDGMVFTGDCLLVGATGRTDVNRQVRKEDFIKLMATERPPPARMPQAIAANLRCGRAPSANEAIARAVTDLHQKEKCP